MTSTMHTFRRHALILLAALVAAPAAAQPARDAPAGHGVQFNQGYIEAITAPYGFEIEDIHSVFEHVFAAMPAEVKVYPTENYYYFTFGYRGLTYAGNMRLDVKDRDEGVLHFAYFNQTEDWNTELTTQYRPMSAVDGVEVAKVEELVYRVTFDGRSVLFRLNDLRDAKVPDGQRGASEVYLGPVFDESGIRFHLMFDEKDSRFMFVLNNGSETADTLLPYSEGDPSILIGMRTGFAFYQDRFLDRKILIGVYAGNVENNNYFDGPFDQLPDNFLKGDELQKALLAAYPDLAGEIDRYGNFREQEGRVLVNPYINYSFLNELEAYRRCGDAQLSKSAFYNCLQPAEGQ